MNEKVINRYCKQVGKILLCNKTHKRELLSGLKQELLDKYNAQPISSQQLMDQVGSPDSMAEQFQSTIDTTEYEKAKKQKRREPFILVVIVIIILSALTVGYLIWSENQRLDHSSTVIIIEEKDDDDILDGMIWGPVVTAEETEESEEP